MLFPTAATAALTAIVAGTVAFPASAASDHAYIAYYESDDCAAGSAVGIGGFVSNETWAFGGADGGSCGAEMSCFLDNASADCASMEKTIDASGQFVVDEEGKFYSCVNEVCRVRDGECNDSALFPNCSFRMISFDDLKEDPSLMMNEGMGATNTAYGVFFSDDKCTDAVGVVGRVSGTSFELPLVGYPEADGSTSTLTCEDMMVCMLNPDGEACSAMKSGVAQLNLETRGENGEDMYLCDSSNEAIGQKECEILSPDVCIESSLLLGCYWRAVSGFTMMKNGDTILTGGMISEGEGTDQNPENPEMPEEEQDTSSSIRTVVGHLMLFALVGAFSFIM